jgi:hypothetical protein
VCVLVVAKAGSALAASIAADAAMTESRRSIYTVYLRMGLCGRAKSSSISGGRTTRRTVTGPVTDGDGPPAGPGPGSLDRDERKGEST